MKDIDAILESTAAYYAKPFRVAIQDLLAALVTDNQPAAKDARFALREVMRETMGIAEVVGATQLLRDAAEHVQPISGDRERILRFREGEPAQRIVPRVSLTEAITDMIERTPVTIRNAAERAGQRIAQLYAQGRVLAFARATEDTVTREAQAILAQQLAIGSHENTAARELSLSIEKVRELSAPWSEGYSRMVFRTNVNTAVTAGRFRQAQDPDIKAVVPAFRFSAIHDGDVRPNHAAADGLIMGVDNSAWGRLAPPLGYNCRCHVALLSLPQLERMGRIGRGGRLIEDSPPAAAHPDPGFRHAGRPDLYLAG